MYDDEYQSQIKYEGCAPRTTKTIVQDWKIETAVFLLEMNDLGKAWKTEAKFWLTTMPVQY